jgi:hypothetical protein
MRFQSPSMSLQTYIRNLAHVLALALACHVFKCYLIWCCANMSWCGHRFCFDELWTTTATFAVLKEIQNGKMDSHAFSKWRRDGFASHAFGIDRVLSMKYPWPLMWLRWHFDHGIIFGSCVVADFKNAQRRYMRDFLYVVFDTLS